MWSVTWLSLFLVTVEFSLHLRLNYFAFRWRPLAKVEVVRNVAALVEALSAPPCVVFLYHFLSGVVMPQKGHSRFAADSFWRSRPLGFSFLLFCCFVVCLPVCNSLWGRGRFALAVKSGRGLSSAGQHGPYRISLPT